MINNVVLTGRLVKDPELRYTPSGDPVANFTLAVQQNFESNGERKADFINCVIWRKAAETLANHTKKGSLIGVEGRIGTRAYENQEGKIVWVTEVIADRFTFLESKKEEPQQEQQSNNQNQNKNQNNNRYNRR